MKFWREILIVGLIIALCLLWRTDVDKTDKILELEKTVSVAEKRKKEFYDSALLYKAEAEKYFKLAQNVPERIKIEKVYVKELADNRKLTPNERDARIRAIFLPR